MLRKIQITLLLVFVLALVATAVVLAEPPQKTDICHHGKTLSISENGWPGHQGHGDLPWACELTLTYYIPVVIGEKG